MLWQMHIGMLLHGYALENEHCWQSGSVKELTQEASLPVARVLWDAVGDASRVWRRSMLRQSGGTGVHALQAARCQASKA